MAVKNVMSVMNDKIFKEIGIGAMVGVGLNAGFAVGDYRQARQEGGTKIGSFSRAAASAIMTDVIGVGPYIGLSLLGAAPKVAMGASQTLDKMSRTASRASTNKPFQNAVFNDTTQAFTMRQAGMQLAKASKHNLQSSMLGQEAQYLRY